MTSYTYENVVIIIKISKLLFFLIGQSVILCPASPTTCNLHEFGIGVGLKRRNLRLNAYSILLLMKSYTASTVHSIFQCKGI